MVVSYRKKLNLTFFHTSNYEYPITVTRDCQGSFLIWCEFRHYKNVPTKFTYWTVITRAAFSNIPIGPYNDRQFTGAEKKFK